MIENDTTPDKVSLTKMSKTMYTITLRQVFWVWVKVAIYSFGGPAGQIVVMHKLLVEEKRWVSENRFLHALNFTMLLPGPEAQQMATYLGWRLHKAKGGLIPGTLFKQCWSEITNRRGFKICGYCWFIG